MNEIWKPITWFEDDYEISNLARVRAFKDYWFKYIALNTLKSWYTQVALRKDWKNYTHYIHRLVGIHFVDNPNNYPCVLHIIESDPFDDTASNLKWGTHKMNTVDMYSKNRDNSWFKKNHPMKWVFWKDNPQSKKIWKYSKEWSLIEIFHWIKNAWRITWLSSWNICQCCKWKGYKTVWWFIWKYIDDDCIVG